MDPADELKMKAKICERLKVLENSLQKFISRDTIENIQSDVRNSYLYSAEEMEDSCLRKPTDVVFDSPRELDG